MVWQQAATMNAYQEDKEEHLSYEVMSCSFSHTPGGRIEGRCDCLSCGPTIDEFGGV